MNVRLLLILFCFCLLTGRLQATVHTVSLGSSLTAIKTALALAQPKDTILVKSGFYQEGNLIVDKPLTLIGENNPVLDGNKQYEILSVKADSVTIKGFVVQNSGSASLDDPGGIKVYDSNHVVITNNTLYNNFFGIYIQYGKHCLVKNNTLVASGTTDELQIGNGIHCWKSDSILIIGNNVSGHRDGIYFEFVTNSVIWRNISFGNVRYGLHFMFSNNDAYITNVFRNNGAGVAVMYTKNVKMYNNVFEKNWGDAAYGLLLKDISDSHIENNRFIQNTSGIYMEGSNRISIKNNTFGSNGWGMKIQASCMDNAIEANNFTQNTFDVSTNGSLVLNTFAGNYWDKYEGYDLNKDKTGDVPYHPLSLFSVIVEKNPPAMLLYLSFMVTLLDKSEKILPSLTPDNFVDNQPLMRPLPL